MNDRDRHAPSSEREQTKDDQYDADGQAQQPNEKGTTEVSKGNATVKTHVFC